MDKVESRKVHKVKSLNLSVVIIAKNEEGVIGDCLESVTGGQWSVTSHQLASLRGRSGPPSTNHQSPITSHQLLEVEVIVLDTGSTDETIEVAKKFGAKVFQYEGSDEINYSAWRNEALKKASGEWVLYLDADERVTPLLKKEILSVTNHQLPITSHYQAFAIPRRNIRLGKEMHHGGWWPDYVLRLIKKEALVKWEGKLHEQPIIKGEVGKLSEPMVHLSHRGSFEHKLTNTIVWSKLEAKMLLAANHPPMTIKRFLGAMVREFYKRMIKYQAWRDGTEGVLEAIYQVFSVFITYAQLWEMQRKGEG